MPLQFRRRENHAQRKRAPYHDLKPTTKTGRSSWPTGQITKPDAILRRRGRSHSNGAGARRTTAQRRTGLRGTAGARWATNSPWSELSEQVRGRLPSPHIGDDPAHRSRPHPMKSILFLSGKCTWRTCGRRVLCLGRQPQRRPVCPLDDERKRNRSSELAMADVAWLARHADAELNTDPGELPIRASGLASPRGQGGNRDRHC